MDREYRYTLPGVIFALPLLLGYLRLGVLSTGSNNVFTVAALLGAVLLSFAAGYPIALAMGTIFSRYLLPKASPKLEDIIKRKYGDRFPDAKTLGMMVSTLHHNYLEEKVLQFLSRRQTGFYMAANSIAAICLGAIIFCSWGLMKGGAASEWRWCFYKLPEVLCGACFVFFAATQAATNYLHHHALIGMVEPLLMEKVEPKNECAKDECAKEHPVVKFETPRLRTLWKWLAPLTVILIAVVATKC